jgi:uncharacterized protein YprB with RNaseH-like and TPR domain
LNKSLKDLDTKLEVIKLKEQGLSGVAIGEKLGIPCRTVQHFLSRQGHDAFWNWWMSVNEEYVEEDSGTFYEKFTKSSPAVKILFFDVETAPMAGSVWSLWNNNVSLNQLERDWYVLSWAAKWQHEDEVMYQDKSSSWDNEDDSELLLGIWQLLDEADIVVGQNSKAFDEKKLNARFILNGMKPPSSYRSIDTLEIAKKHFGFTSNKLEYMTHNLCKKYKKLNHGTFAGFELWKECLRGNPEAWAEMQDYNKFDVLALEELYNILRPWYKQHPNLNIYREDTNNKCVCGSDNFCHSGYHYTNMSKFDKWKCEDCGAEVRGKINLLPKEKRTTLTRNIL